MNAVVPIIQNDEKVGVGFIVQHVNKQYLITAKHVISGPSVFYLNGNPITLDNPVYISEGTLYQPKNNYFSDCVIFGLRDRTIIAPIVLKPETISSMDDEFELITIDKSLNYLRVDCKPYNNEQNALLFHDQSNWAVYTNAFQLGSLNVQIKCGFSGSPVFEKGNSGCIGLLSSGRPPSEGSKFQTLATFVKSSHILTLPPFRDVR